MEAGCGDYMFARWGLHIRSVPILWGQYVCPVSVPCCQPTSSGGERWGPGVQHLPIALEPGNNMWPWRGSASSNDWPSPTTLGSSTYDPSELCFWKAGFQATSRLTMGQWTFFFWLSQAGSKGHHVTFSESQSFQGDSRGSKIYNSSENTRGGSCSSACWSMPWNSSWNVLHLLMLWNVCLLMQRCVAFFLGCLF